jgi:lysophospholipase L1-like esterase
MSYDHRIDNADALAAAVSKAIAASSADVNISNTELLRKNICVCGDSTANQNTAKSGNNTYFKNGPVVTMLDYLGWPVNFDHEDNYGIGGSTTRECIDDQLPLIKEAHRTKQYKYCFVSTGTNDGNKTLATRLSDTLELVTEIRKMGIIPVSVGIRPKGADAADTTQKQNARSVNKYLYQLAGMGYLIYVDVTSVYADISTAFGNMLTATSNDNLHPNFWGAMLEGKLLADTVGSLLGVNTLKFATEQADGFDRLENPYGITQASPNPLLIGGTTAPSNMGSSGGTWSKSTFALANGQTRASVQCILAASTTHYLFQTWTATGNWTASQMKYGDIVEAYAKIKVVDGVNIQRIVVYASESDGTTTSIAYGGTDGTTTANLPDGTYTLIRKSPRLILKPYAGTGNRTVSMRIQLITSSGGSGTVTIEGFELRPVYLSD